MKKLFCTILIIAASLFAHSQVFQQWKARYNGPDSLFDGAVAVDARGCVYVAGITQDATNESHIAVLRYSPGGTLLWAAVDSTHGNEGVGGIAVDNNCNVYVTGTGTSSSQDFITIKYDSTGAMLWTAIYDGPGNLFDVAKAIALDNTGSVYVTGTSQNNSLMTTVKYNTNGVQQWVATYGGTSSVANDIAVDANNNVYVTGYSHNGTSIDYTALKYSSSGVQQWAAL